jgi:GcrA cell cycle regulator
MQTNWAPEHCVALRDHLARGMSYSEIADTINAKFGTAYSRSATIGRARRMGLAVPDRCDDGPSHFPRLSARAGAPRLNKPDERDAFCVFRPMPVFERAEPLELRCVEIVPRHLSLIDLEPRDCRYPYGGDQEGAAITFCGHPRRSGSSYCVPHFHLTRNPDIASERATGAASLRLVEGRHEGLRDRHDCRGNFNCDRRRSDKAAATPDSASRVWAR